MAFTWNKKRDIFVAEIPGTTLGERGCLQQPCRGHLHPSCIPRTLRQAPRISLKCPGGDTQSCHHTWPVPALACPLEGTHWKMEHINLFSAWNQSQNLGRQSTRDSIATRDIVTAASLSWKTTQERRGKEKKRHAKEHHLSEEQSKLQRKQAPLMWSCKITAQLCRHKECAWGLSPKETNWWCPTG